VISRDGVWATVLAKTCMRAIDAHLCQSHGLLPQKISVRLPKRSTLLVFPTVYEDSLDMVAFYRPRSEEFTEHLWHLRQEERGVRFLEAEWRFVCDAHLVVTAYQGRDDLGFEFADATHDAIRSIMTDVAFWNRVLTSTQAA
jgi:hypothetical protein